MKYKKALLVILLSMIVKNISTQEFSAYDLLKSCSNYKNWIENDFDIPVNQQLLFNMGKCQGIMETTGKMMLTLCVEKKRNVDINEQISANLKGIRTKSLIDEFVSKASQITNLQKYSAQNLLSRILSKKWPCS